MSNKLYYYKFEIQSWRSDSVFTCSLAARGLWLEMMNMMHVQERYGYLSRNGSPIPSEAIARYCGSSLEQYELLLKELFDAGVPGRTAAGIIYSRRMVRDEKQRREWNERQQTHRDNKTECHKDVTPKSPITITIEDSDFDLFWNLYPRKVGKPAARRAWMARNGAPKGVLLDGLEAWRNSEEWRDPQFIPHPATFLNQRRWEDKPLAARKKLAGVEAHVGAGPLERAPRICAKCGGTGSWHLNAAKRGQALDHEFAEAM